MKRGPGKLRLPGLRLIGLLLCQPVSLVCHQLQANPSLVPSSSLIAPPPPHPAAVYATKSNLQVDLQRNCPGNCPGSEEKRTLSRIYSNQSTDKFDFVPEKGSADVKQDQNTPAASILCQKWRRNRPDGDKQVVFPPHMPTHSNNS